jgi:hypothetical protein
MIINTVYELVQQLMAKFSAGGYMPNKDFDNYSNLTQQQKLEFDLKVKDRGTYNSENLSLFKVNEMVTALNGIIQDPEGYRYFDTAFNMDTSTGSAIPAAFEEVTTSEWDFRIGSELDRPSLDYPAMVKRNGYLEIAPKTIQSINLTYVKNPPAPVWGYTVANNRRVYSESASTDFTFDESDIPDLVYRILYMGGVNIRDRELIEVAASERQIAQQ